MRELLHAARVLRRSPVFSIAVAATVAIGVGATTAIYALVDAAMLRPPPFREPDRLVMLYRTVRLPDGRSYRTRWSYPTYRALRDRVRGFAPVASMTHAALNLGTPDFAARVEGETVSASYFATLGVRPLLGRTFTAEEDAAPGTHPVIVLGYDAWRARYGSDPRIVGRVVRGNGVPLTVVGVMPPGFAGLSGRGAFWVPDMMAPSLFYADQLTSGEDFINVVARLAPGVAPERAEAELAAVGRAVALSAPAEEPDEPGTERAATAVPLDEARANPARRHALLVLLGAVTFVLLIACANLANLFAIHVRARTREIAIRLSLGARRGWIARQLLVQATLLSLAGGAAGLALAAAAMRVLDARAVRAAATPANDYAQLSEFGAARLDWRVAAFALALSAGVGVMFGLAPALRAARTDLTGLIKGSTAGLALGTGRRPRRVSARGTLVMAEVALALVTLLGAALMLESLARLRRVPTGFRPDGVTAFWVSMPETRYPLPAAPAAIGRVLERVSAVPGVRSATVSRCTPLSSRCARYRAVSDRALATGERQGVPVGRHYVAPAHFATLGIPLRRGRAFTSADREGAPRVAVINEAAARALWPGEEALGRRLWFGSGAGPLPADSAATVVGVVGDVRYWPPGEPAGPDVYTPFAQFGYASTYVMVRAAAEPAALTRAVREAVRAVDPDLAVDDGRPLAAWVDAAAAGTRYDAAVLSALAAAALLLAAVGVYGVMADAVGGRTRELGIRVALGATPGRVLAAVLGEGATL
ncbi:MAG TPA: ADOP family duplicated permease, partial [Gemmatimonadaceae bacterium]|nr:ADOP family duplicated permease [Gemmatimonadaceae bacterium]